jgi:peptidoglycan/xylan/chitin deacetylase (PgdA/CDA1 family)
MTLDFRVTAPAGADERHRYVVDVVFRRWFELTVELVPGTGDSWEISAAGSDAVLTLPSIVLGSDAWAPAEPLESWYVAEAFPEARTVEPHIPLIAGRGVAGESSLRVDVLGSAFWMLARSEELDASKRDAHDRFPAVASLAYRNGFLDRPIVDEYGAVLYAAMRRLWPRLPARQQTGNVWITSDVDVPYDCSARSASEMTRALAGDVVRRRSVATAARRLRNWPYARRGNYRHDPNNTFDFILEQCARHDRRAAFFFIAGHSHGRIDGCYTLEEPFLQELLQKVVAHGHEVGMHGSYGTFRDLPRIERERSTLESVCRRLGLNVTAAGNRQHYLRWDSARTPVLLSRAGFAYDTTGGYADRPGFRYGTARPFPMWDWQGRKALSLLQRPLVFMDATIFGSNYLGLTDAGVITALGRKLCERARRYGGDFVLLWHSNNLQDAFQRGLFQEAVSW